MAPQHCVFLQLPFIDSTRSPMLPACLGCGATDEHIFGVVKAKHVPGGLPDVCDAPHSTGTSELGGLP